MSPRRAKDILKAWVRGSPRTRPPHGSNPEVITGPLTAQQRLALYRLLTCTPERPSEPPPLHPHWLPPP